MDFLESIFVAWAVVVGILVLLAICHLVGLLYLRIRRTGRVKLYYMRRKAR